MLTTTINIVVIAVNAVAGAAGDDSGGECKKPALTYGAPAQSRRAALNARFSQIFRVINLRG